MRKLIVFLIITIIALSIPAGLAFLDNRVLILSNTAVDALCRQKLTDGVTIQSLDFQNVRRNGLSSVHWDQIKAVVVIKNDKQYLMNKEFTVKIDKLELILKDLITGNFLLTAREFSATPLFHPKQTDQENASDSEGLEKGLFEVMIRLALFPPSAIKSQLKEIVNQLWSLLTDGTTKIPVYFSGITTFSINQAPVKAKVNTYKTPEGYYKIRINPEVLKSIAWQMNEELTDAETALLADNPFKIQDLFSIMATARNASEKYKNSDMIPEDAYRHVLWSYLLTTKYGPEFAQKVTDAHEEGDLSNTEAEHEMDYHNNAIGREYALKKYNKTEILSRMLNDTRVIRTPKE
jgi:hypothetical protein